MPTFSLSGSTAPITVLVLILTLGLAPARAAPPSADDATESPVPAAGSEAFPLDQIRVGMTGYGRTVFQGTKIEAFPIEVQAVVDSGSAPGRSVVWVTSPDPRLQETGPVQGMSGSPIYLWNQGEEQTPGHGGRLLGAFAFGYALSKGCLIGVQPIQYMRDIDGRARDAAEDQPQKVHAGGSRGGYRMLARLSRIAAVRGARPTQRFQIDRFRRLLADAAGLDDGQHNPDSSLLGRDEDRAPVSLPAQFASLGRGAQPMMLPLNVGSQQVAAVLKPLLEPMGMMPIAGGPMVGKPPSYIDRDTPLEPGSTLTIPYAFGDMELAAAGTATDVLPDGTVLAFGHAMDAVGATAVPMASGYVHFIVPRLSTSFKRAGSLKVRGTLVRDEQVGVAGIPQTTFKTAPLTAVIDMSDRDEQTYHFQVVDHPTMTPSIAASLVAATLTAQQNLPPDNTVSIDTTMSFEGGHAIHFRTVLPQADASAVVYAVLPPMVVLIQNPHHDLSLTSMKLTATVRPKILSGNIVSARLDEPTAEPGETLGVTARYQAYGSKTIHTKHLKLIVPANTPAGEYPLAVTGPAGYQQRVIGSKPYLLHTTNVDELTDAVQQILDVDPEAMYAILQLPTQGVAVGRQEMPKLPSSLQTVLTSKISTRSSRYPQTIHTRARAGLVFQNEQTLTVRVIDPTKSKP